MMNDVNLKFLLYFVDRRDVLQIKAEIEKILNCKLETEKADVPEEETRDSFESVTMGIYVGMSKAALWPEGNVYRLVGGTDSWFYSPKGEMVSIVSHVARVLRHGGITALLEPEEFAARNRG
jgi:hypothetical protein